MIMLEKCVHESVNERCAQICEHSVQVGSLDSTSHGGSFVIVLSPLTKLHGEEMHGDEEKSSWFPMLFPCSAPLGAGVLRFQPLSLSRASS